MLRWLFVDMNSYFASVEQHLRPQLRGKPVAVVAVETDSTSCIAASYEAKAFGIKTGTNVGLARHLCPGLHLVKCRPPLYVDMHHRIIKVVESHLHVDKVLSIDEMACRLPSNWNSEAQALQIAHAIKQSLLDEIGPCIRCSIGIAPNRFLAKVGSDMQKPDGLVVLHARDLPQKILHLGIRDLPGVAKQMQLRLSAHGADTMQALWNFSPEQLFHAFGGRIGRHFWSNLHGEPVDERETHRGSFNHSSVLAPEWRNDKGAYAVLVRLIHKAAARLRDQKYAAGQMALSLSYIHHESWHAHIGIEDAQDTQTLVEAMDYLWQRRKAGPRLPNATRRINADPRIAEIPTLKKVGIALYDLQHASNLTLPLFGRDERRLSLAKAMDNINGRFGRQMLYFGEMHDTRNAARMRIAFNSVPDDDW